MRELYNQNIGSLITSLYHQDLSDLAFDKVELWVVVNNVRSAPADVRLENQETVNFLKELAHSRVPVVSERHQILRTIGRQPVSRKVGIQIVDQTTPGNEVRNIGAVRDFATKAALKSLQGHDPERVLVSHMDADATFDRNFVRSIVKAFESEKLKFALLDMSYADQFDSEPRVYQRKILADYQLAAHSFRLARDGAMPVGGSPRIVTRAQTLSVVGGVPHETVGEDTKLIEKLKTAFPDRGRYLDVQVRANYRAREDGYDAAIYQRSIAEPILFTEWMLSTTPMLNETELYFQRHPLMDRNYNEALKHHLMKHSTQVRDLRLLVSRLVHNAYSGKAESPGAILPALVDNQWFAHLIKSEVKLHGPRADHAVLRRLSNDFPYYFAEPAPAEIMIISRMKAATQTLLNKAVFEKPQMHPIYFPVLAEKYPETAALSISLSPSDFQRRFDTRRLPSRIRCLNLFTPLAAGG